MSDLKIFTDNIEPTALNQIYTLVKQPAFAEAAHDFWVKRKCGKDYRIVVLKSVEVKRMIDYYDSKNFI